MQSNANSLYLLSISQVSQLYSFWHCLWAFLRQPLSNFLLCVEYLEVAGHCGTVLTSSGSLPTLFLGCQRLST